MKKLITLITVCLLAGVSYAGELSKADQKWSAAVEKMIAAGPATISTPDENRAKLAKELADKHGRKSKIEKMEKGYKVVVQAAKSQRATVAPSKTAEVPSPRSQDSGHVAAD